MNDDDDDDDEDVNKNDDDDDDDYCTLICITYITYMHYCPTPLINSTKAGL